MDFAKLLYVDGMVVVTLVVPTVLVAFWFRERITPAVRPRKVESAGRRSLAAAE
jgi:hypothetical protein